MPENNSYEQILQAKNDELERERIEKQEEYERQAKELENRYNEEIKELEERKKIIQSFQNISSNESIAEFLENMDSNIEKLGLSPEEEISVLTHLALTSAETIFLDLEEPVEKTPILEEEPINEKANISNAEPKKLSKKDFFPPKPRVKEDDIDISILDGKTDREVKDIISTEGLTITKRYKRILLEKDEYALNHKIQEVMNILYNGTETIGDETNIAKLLADLDFKYRRIEDNYLSLDKRIGLSDKIKIKSSRSELEETYRIIKETQNLISDYKKDYNRFRRLYEEIHKNDKIEENKEIKLDVNDKQPDKPSTEDNSKREKVKKIDRINSEELILSDNLSSESESGYEEIKEFIARYESIINDAEFKKDKSFNYVTNGVNTIKSIMKSEDLTALTEAEMNSRIEAINEIIKSIEVAVSEKIRKKLFVSKQKENINIGSKNIVVFAKKPNDEYAIVDQLNSLKSGDRKKVVADLINSISTKYTEFSWMNNLRYESHNLKGSLVDLGGKKVEAKSHPTTGNTRRSVVQLQLCAENKEKLKERYLLDDDFEGVLLIGGVTLEHKIDEVLVGQINSQANGITAINNLFMDPKTDIDILASIIDESSELCSLLKKEYEMSK